MNIPVAAVQADVVGHSMGGVIVRTITRSQTFLSDNTFRQGNVHKLITIDTPHLGSPVASALLDPNQENGCLQDLLARHDDFVFSSVVFEDGTSPSGAIADLAGNGNGVKLSDALLYMRKPDAAHIPPTALIYGIYTNFGSLDGGRAFLIRNWPHKPVYGCPDDPLAQMLTSTGWPALFATAAGDNFEPNDGIVSVTSQLDGLTPSPGSQCAGCVHSQGTEDLGFAPPSVMEPGTVPNQVIFLLNTPYSNAVYYKLLNP